MEYKSAKLCDQWDIWKKEERERRSLDHDKRQRDTT